jgi:hypothetical protein
VTGKITSKRSAAACDEEGNWGEEGGKKFHGDSRDACGEWEGTALNGMTVHATESEILFIEKIGNLPPLLPGLAGVPSGPTRHP